MTGRRSHGRLSALNGVVHQGIVETDTENERVLTPFLRSLVERGLDLAQGVLERFSNRPCTTWGGRQGTNAAVRHRRRRRVTRRYRRPALLRRVMVGAPAPRVRSAGVARSAR